MITYMFTNLLTDDGPNMVHIFYKMTYVPWSQLAGERKEETADEGIVGWHKIKKKKTFPKNSNKIFCYTVEYILTQ